MCSTLQQGHVTVPLINISQCSYEHYYMAQGLDGVVGYG